MLLLYGIVQYTRCITGHTAATPLVASNDEEAVLLSVCLCCGSANYSLKALPRIIRLYTRSRERSKPTGAFMQLYDKPTELINTARKEAEEKPREAVTRRLTRDYSTACHVAEKTRHLSRHIFWRATYTLQSSHLLPFNFYFLFFFNRVKLI